MRERIEKLYMLRCKLSTNTNTAYVTKISMSTTPNALATNSSLTL